MISHRHFPDESYAYVAIDAAPRFVGQHIYSTPLCTFTEMEQRLLTMHGNPHVASPMFVARFELAKVEEWEVDQSNEARAAFEARRAERRR